MRHFCDVAWTKTKDDAAWMRMSDNWVMQAPPPAGSSMPQLPPLSAASQGGGCAAPFTPLGWVTNPPLGHNPPCPAHPPAGSEGRTQIRPTSSPHPAQTINKTHAFRDRTGSRQGRRAAVGLDGATAGLAPTRSGSAPGSSRRASGSEPPLAAACGSAGCWRR